MICGSEFSVDFSGATNKHFQQITKGVLIKYTVYIPVVQSCHPVPLHMRRYNNHIHMYTCTCILKVNIEKILATQIIFISVEKVGQSKC